MHTPDTDLDTTILTREQRELAFLMKALSHPVRVYIVELLTRQSCCYSGDLAEELPIARSTLSQHLKELKKVGLIQGEINPPKIKYCINRARWQQMERLMQQFLAASPPLRTVCDPISVSQYI